MKKIIRQTENEKQKAHEQAMLMFAEDITQSCRAIQERLKKIGFNINHSTVFKWLKKA